MPGWDTGTLRFEAAERKGRSLLILPVVPTLSVATKVSGDKALL